MSELDTSVVLSLTQWLQVIAVGGFAGLAGQVVRVAAGLKKAADEASAKGEALSETFDSTRLMVSLLIGAIAGFFALASQVDPSKGVTVQVVLGVMAAGYAGTDFVEAFVRRYLPQSPTKGDQSTDQDSVG